MPHAAYSAEFVARFWKKVARGGPGDCWQWVGYVTRGYGQYQVRDGRHKRSFMAHRVAYELIVGPIPEGLTIDHLCRNRGCVNPAHLEPVPIGVNVLRGTAPTAIHARKTHCPAGHPYSGDNLYVRPDDHRECRACIRRRDRERRPRRNAA